MKKILLLTTGGTIASLQDKGGLTPKLNSSDILKYISEINLSYKIEHEDILSLDSSNIQPEQWKVIARKVYSSIENYDGIIITHGTDTMAYTASALCFILQNLNKSVVLTGSQLPIDRPLTDARTNFYTAVAAIESGIKGVSIAFNRKIINGTRAVKVSTMGFDAFESINAPCTGQIFADGMHILSPQILISDESKSPKLMDNICTDVFLLKLIPGTKPEIFDALINMHYKGIVIEAFGAGGLHYVNRDLSNKLKEVSKAGIAIVVCSQCLYERSDLSLYEVGRRLLSTGIIHGHDMTTEAASTKLMWALGQTSNLKEIREIFSTNFVGEVTLPTQK